MRHLVSGLAADVLCVICLAGPWVCSDLAAQEPRVPESPVAVIDTIILDRQGVFPDSVDAGVLGKVMNAAHKTTFPFVIRSELLFRAGQPYDEALVLESERNLRGRLIFSSVSLDSLRLDDGRLAVRVRTVDAWSTSPKVNFNVAADGTVTSIFGITERNAIGTGANMKVWYRKDVDRSGLDAALDLRRAFGSPLAVSGSYQNLSDQEKGDWRLGRPYYSLTQRFSAEYDGEAFNGRIFRFRTVEPPAQDTTFFFRRALINRLTIGFAPSAGTGGYLRVGLKAEVRQEEILLTDDSLGVVPDSVYGEVGAFIEYRSAGYETIRYFNAFSEEDQDLSEVISLTVKLAPAAWGYESTGFGPQLHAAAGGRVGKALVKASVTANALFNSAGLDSGRVVLLGSGGFKPAERHSTLLQVEAGWQDSPSPGTEFDLGFQTPPRLWEPHAFTGDRSVRVSLEHRWFTWDSVLNLAGIGFGGFADYAGAWFEDQDRRLGGNIGLSLLMGSSLSAVPATGSLSFGYRFGDDVIGDRFQATFLASLTF